MKQLIMIALSGLVSTAALATQVPGVCITDGTSQEACSPGSWNGVSPWPHAGAACLEAELQVMINPDDYSGTDYHYFILTDGNPFTAVWYGPFYNNSPASVYVPATSGTFQIYAEIHPNAGGLITTYSVEFDAISAPTPSLSMPTDPCIGESFNFTASGTHCASSSFYSLSLNMGDGTTYSNSANACLFSGSHTYYVGYGVLATLTAENQCGESSTSLEVYPVDCSFSPGGGDGGGGPMPKRGLESSEESAAYTFEIYPNPTSGLVTLKWNNALEQEETLLTIRDMQGKLVKAFELQSNITQVELDLETLQAGVYYLSGILNDQHINEMIIVN